MPAGRAAVLAIDGGNSKTDVALVAADGTLLASGRGPGSRAFPTAATIAAIGAAIAAAAARTRACRRAGRSPSARSPAWPTRTCPRRSSGWPALLAAAGWGAATPVANDTFAVLRAGLDAPARRAVGRGGNLRRGHQLRGRRPGRADTGFLALGGITGDWGGGLGLGRAALWWAIRAEDGRGPETALRAAVAAHFGLPAVRDVAVAIHQGEIGEDDLQGLAPVLLAAARAGDQVAGGLVSKLADEIVTMAGTVIGRLGLAGAAVPVVLGGGLLTARDPQLTGWITRRMASRAPLARVSVVTVPPIAGAALLGLDRAGAGPAAERRLRAAYAAAAGPGGAAG